VSRLALGLWFYAMRGSAIVGIIGAWAKEVYFSSSFIYASGRLNK
jgi:hypothetical protein